MLRRVEMEGIKLPRLYIAENKKDVLLAQSNGIPYIKWTHGVAELIRCILRPQLEKAFPYIKWNQVLGKRHDYKTEVVMVEGFTSDHDFSDDILDKNEFLDIEKRNKDSLLSINDPVTFDVESEVANVATSDREFDDGDVSASITTTMRNLGSVYDYCGDTMSNVNLEVLQQLGMLPKFLGDITDCIKVNLSNNMRWTEGYNKKLGVPIGRFGGKGYLKNLIILDISASIPRGIAATMISLIDTLRSQVDADLIITATRSGFYSMDDELPTPQVIRDAYPPGQEAREFMNIAAHHIKGNEYGHVISFGDNDTPFNSWLGNFGYEQFVGTKVHAVHHYHTFTKRQTGYAKWCKICSPNCTEEFDTSWCSFIKQ